MGLLVVECHFLVHVLLWILVTIRVSIEHHFAIKQQVIDRNSHARGKLLHLRIGSQLVKFWIWEFMHAGNVSVAAIWTDQVFGRMKIGRLVGKALSISFFFPAFSPVGYWIRGSPALFFKLDQLWNGGMNGFANVLSIPHNLIINKGAGAA